MRCCGRGEVQIGEDPSSKVRGRDERYRSSEALVSKVVFLDLLLLFVLPIALVALLLLFHDH